MTRIFSILAFILFAQVSFGATVKSIYGTDDRITYPEMSIDQQDFAESVAAQISKSKITSIGLEFLDLKYKTLVEELNLCSSEKFSFSPRLSDCSGFLVTDDLLMTAGHCVKDTNDCANKVWAFGYDEVAYDGTGKTKIKTKDIYSCQEVIEYKEYKNGKNYVDYALVKLDRKVEGRNPLKVKHLEYFKPSSDLVIIGHPLGMPKMLVNNFRINGKFSDINLKVNADTFSGNSGSPMIDQASGTVVGMLIRGESDFIYDIDESCNRIKRCNLNTCKGELILNFKSFPLKQIPFHY